jgi:hypothetical protein
MCFNIEVNITEFKMNKTSKFDDIAIWTDRSSLTQKHVLSFITSSLQTPFHCRDAASVAWYLRHRCFICKSSVLKFQISFLKFLCVIFRVFSFMIVIISPTHAQFTSLLYTLAYMFRPHRAIISQPRDTHGSTWTTRYRTKFNKKKHY